MTCVHDAWYKTDRLWLAILVVFMTVIIAAQAYRMGEKAGHQAGWDACMEQF